VDEEGKYHIELVEAREDPAKSFEAAEQPFDLSPRSNTNWRVSSPS
jgi:hypothetical protein